MKCHNCLCFVTFCLKGFDSINKCHASGILQIEKSDLCFHVLSVLCVILIIYHSIFLYSIQIWSDLHFERTTYLVVFVVHNNKELNYLCRNAEIREIWFVSLFCKWTGTICLASGILQSVVFVLHNNKELNCLCRTAKIRDLTWSFSLFCKWIRTICFASGILQLNC